MLKSAFAVLAATRDAGPVQHNQPLRQRTMQPVLHRFGHGRSVAAGSALYSRCCRGCRGCRGYCGCQSIKSWGYWGCWGCWGCRSGAPRRGWDVGSLSRPCRPCSWTCRRWRHRPPSRKLGQAGLGHPEDLHIVRAGAFDDVVIRIRVDIDVGAFAAVCVVLGVGSLAFAGAGAARLRG